MKMLNVDNCIIEKEILEYNDKLVLKGFVELERQASNNVFVPIKLFFEKNTLAYINNVLSGSGKGFDIAGEFLKNENAELELYNPYISPTSSVLKTGSIVINADVLIDSTVESNNAVVGKTIGNNAESICIIGDKELYNKCQSSELSVIKSIGEYLHTPERIYIKSIYHELTNLNTRIDKSIEDETVFDIYPKEFQSNNQKIPWVDSIIL